MRRGTLTVPPHTPLPSENLGRGGLSTVWPSPLGRVAPKGPGEVRYAVATTAALWQICTAAASSAPAALTGVGAPSPEGKALNRSLSIRRKNPTTSSGIMLSETPIPEEIILPLGCGPCYNENDAVCIRPLPPLEGRWAAKGRLGGVGTKSFGNDANNGHFQISSLPPFSRLRRQLPSREALTDAVCV